MVQRACALPAVVGVSIRGQDAPSRVCKQGFVTQTIKGCGTLFEVSLILYGAGIKTHFLSGLARNKSDLFK